MPLHTIHVAPSVPPMLVQYRFPKTLSPGMLDVYLANGWFRNSHMLFRSQIICLEKDIFSVVNIRLPLPEYKPSKKLMKMLRRNREIFRVEIGPLDINEEKELLYEQHKDRFRGYLFNSLRELFHATSPELLPSESITGLFNTKELRVYDEQGKLVAVSFFDEGANSMAGLLALYSSQYGKYSLGIFTMLEEVLYAKEQGMVYYYPGYVLDGPSPFQYKCTLGKEQMEFYEWHGLWRPFTEFTPDGTVGDVLKKKLSAAEDLLSKAGIPHHRILYPMFSIGYLSGFECFMKSVAYIACYQHAQSERYLTIEYLLEEHCYVMRVYRVAKEMLDFTTSNISSTDELKDADIYASYPLEQEEELYRSRHIATLVAELGALEEGGYLRGVLSEGI